MISSGFAGKTYTKFVIKYHQNPWRFEGSMRVLLGMQKSLFGKVGKAFQSTFFQMNFLLVKISEIQKSCKNKSWSKRSEIS